MLYNKNLTHKKHNMLLILIYKAHRVQSILDVYIGILPITLYGFGWLYRYESMPLFRIAIVRTFSRITMLTTHKEMDASCSQSQVIALGCEAKFYINFYVKAHFTEQNTLFFLGNTDWVLELVHIKQTACKFLGLLINVFSN